MLGRKNAEPVRQAPANQIQRVAKLALSVFIITKNEEQRLPRTLDALTGWVGEIVVVDCGSTDRTLEIAKDYGARIVHREFDGYGPQKRFAEQLCAYDWVLNLDADEVVTPTLKREIIELFPHSEPAPAAYRVKILTVYPGRDRPRPLASDYNVVRLYHRKAGSYRDHAVFDRVITRVPARQLRAPIHHFSHVSFRHAIEKLNTFSDFRAETTGHRSGAGLVARLAIEFPLSFAKFYLIRRHCFGGWRGLYFAMAQAFMRTTRIAKMLEKQQT
jgi:glycosyltransferase involved in cell wall biosynthesis